MTTSLLVTVTHPDQSTAVRDSGAEVLATYPDSMLVRATDEQAEQLRGEGIEATALPEQQIRLGGAQFAFADAVSAQDAAAIEPSPGRTAYYLVKLAGPPAADWLATLADLDVAVHSNLADFTMLVGMLPERADTVREQAWVVDVTPYRPAMKLSPALQTRTARTLGPAELAGVDAADIAAPAGDLVEVSVFPGEDVRTVADAVTADGGTVLSTRPQSVIVNASRATIAAVAALEGVLAVLPYDQPVLHNDRATRVIGIPADHKFGGTPLSGSGQIVGIADSGLDSGDPATVHEDVRGRVAGLVSWAMPDFWAPYVQDAPGHDDGAVDDHSGHGTHVTGSVLGDGTVGRAAGVDPAPAGAAPEARVFFQAVEQAVTWKTAAQLAADGLEPPLQDWPPAPVGLYGLPADLTELFAQAYEAGVRVHTNSWGAATAGEYNERARTVDAFLWEHPDMLILFSAGNSGVDADQDGVIDDDSIGSPGVAKNCLTVGASENDRPHGSSPKPGRDGNWDQLGNPLRWPALHDAGHVSDDIDGMAAFSSRGPTDDGRIKPDVVAPGTNILSTLSTVFPAGQTPLWGRLAAGEPLRDGYCWSGGTSMSTPLVAGTVALVRQYLVDQRGHLHDGRQPSGALMKAVLIGGAVAMPGQFTGEVPAGQNPVTGFGRVDAAAAVLTGGGPGPLFADDPDDAVATGQMRTFTVSGIDTALPLRATLVWTDAPAPAKIGGLENQLYLQVVDPNGDVVDGDVTPFPTATNNVQQVVIDNPVEGDYTVRVRGVSVTQQSPGAADGSTPRQDFALVVSGGTGLS